MAKHDMGLKECMHSSFKYFEFSHSRLAAENPIGNFCTKSPKKDCLISSL